MAAVAAEEADADSTAYCPSFNVGAHRIDSSHGLVPGNTRPLDRK
jgi:hypothetical protein